MSQIAVVLGTRPEIVKLSQIIRLLGDDLSLIHTGQHYNTDMSDTFFDLFELPPPDHHIGVGGTTRGNQIGEATKALDELWQAERPVAVIVQGDTNTVLAGALAANANNIPLVHVEAGLRSYDRRMPEEHNRVLTDHLADLLCAPTNVNVSNLAAEGLADNRVLLTGNTVVEALGRVVPSASEARSIAQRYDVGDDFALVTLHRPENVDSPDSLAEILTELRAIPMQVLFPMHPRTALAAKSMNTGDIKVVAPVDYREFLGLLHESRIAISDSGGVQEEVSVLKKPLVVVRRSTERPEVLGTFANLVRPSDIAATVASWTPERSAALAQIESPYGDGSASGTIVERARLWL